MVITQVIVSRAAPQDRAHAKARRGEGEMCGSTRIHILTLCLRGFASSREHRSPAKPLATASFFTQVQRRVAVKKLRMTQTVVSAISSQPLRVNFIVRKASPAPSSGGSGRL